MPGCACGSRETYYGCTDPSCGYPDYEQEEQEEVEQEEEEE